MQINPKQLQVAVTGIGLSTSIGTSPSETWKAILKSQSGIQWVEVTPGEYWPFGVALSTSNQNTSFSRAHDLALQASHRALQDSGVEIKDIDSERIGVSVSTSKGDIKAFLGGREPFSLQKINSAIMSSFNARGPCLNIVAACATGLQSIIWGARWVEEGRADCVIAGASDSVLIPFLLHAYKKSGMLAKSTKDEDPRSLLRPFDKKRSGTVLGEGAGVVILESVENALRRGARIYAVILAGYSGIDGYHELKMDPSGKTVAQALRIMTRRANFSAERINQIDYINLHGTGTRWNDLVETRGVKSFFQEAVRHISFSSTKPFTGHLVGASGAVEFIISLLAMRHQFVPPTLNLQTPDFECDLDYTPLEGGTREIRHFACLSYGFGGQVAGILAGKI